MDAAMRVNNSAVELLKQNRNNEAVQCLREGVRCLLVNVKQRQEYHSSAVVEQRAEFSSSLSFPQNESNPDLHVFAVELQNFAVPEDGLSPDSIFKVFNNSFGIFLDTSIMERSSITRHENLVASILLFNAALACHREGILNGSNKRLYGALHFYECAFDSLCAANGLEMDMLSFFYQIKLAIATNMGHIHSSFFHHEQAMFWRNELVEAMNAVSNHSDYIEGGFECFFDDAIFVFQSAGTTLAPAA